jgi:hypothetical protein
MLKVINDGGAILHKGHHLTRPEHLPSEAELAEGDATATQTALDGISAQRAALDEQERKLLASRAPVADAKKDAASGDQNDSAPNTGTTTKKGGAA